MTLWTMKNHLAVVLGALLCFAWVSALDQSSNTGDESRFLKEKKRKQHKTVSDFEFERTVNTSFRGGYSVTDKRKNGGSGSGSSSGSKKTKESDVQRDYLESNKRHSKKSNASGPAPTPIKPVPTMSHVPTMKPVLSDGGSRKKRSGDSGKKRSKKNNRPQAPTSPTASKPTPTGRPGGKKSHKGKKTRKGKRRKSDGVQNTPPKPVPAVPMPTPKPTPEPKDTRPPTAAPVAPSLKPVVFVVEEPSSSPTGTPTTAPSRMPSAVPSTPVPTPLPSAVPSRSPAPSSVPSVSPSTSPSWVPSVVPSKMPSVTPSTEPSFSLEPSAAPSTSFAPSRGPTAFPTRVPSPLSTGKNVRSLILQAALAGSDFNDPDTYQSKALKWTEDWAKLSSIEPSDDEVMSYFALACFYHSTYQVDNIWTEGSPFTWVDNTNWLNTAESYCNWFGIVCDGDGKVERIQMEANNLTGYIPNEIGFLSESLVEVTLPSNWFDAWDDEGTAWIGTLVNLKTLNLDECYVDYVGVPTSVAQLTKLETLSIYYTYIAGPLEGSIFSGMSNLKYIDLSYNQFSSAVPAELGLPNVETFIMYDSAITGSLDFLKTMESLVVFEMYQNPGLTGTIPTEVGNMLDLALFDIANCGGIMGPVPTQFSALPSLAELYLHGNSLTGQVPAGFCANVAALQADGLSTGVGADCPAAGPVTCACCDCCGSTECAAVF